MRWPFHGNFPLGSHLVERISTTSKLSNSTEGFGVKFTPNTLKLPTWSVTRLASVTLGLKRFQTEKFSIVFASKLFDETNYGGL